MALQPIDITTPQPNGKLGDPARVMSQKINANDQYLEQLAQGADTKATAAKATADAALPKSGGTTTGPIFRAGVQNQEMFRIQNTGTQVGIGGSFGSWSSNRTPGLQVDCQSRADAYMVARATNWGVAHLFALDVYQGTTSDVITANFHFPGKENAMRFFANGNVTFAGTLTQNSDYRIKDEVQTIDPVAAASALRMVRPVEYTDIQGGSSGPRRAGVIAHELQEHLPLLVDGEKDATETIDVAEGDLTPYAPGTEPEGYVPPVMKLRQVPKLQAVNYAGSTVYVIAGWQEHDGRIERLEAALALALEKIAALEAAA